MIKFVGAIFEKIEILIFFLGELPLILRVGQKQKYGLEIFARLPYISNLKYMYWSVSLGPTLGDGKTFLKYFLHFQGYFREKPIVSH